MAESEYVPVSESTSHLQPILDLLESAGFVHIRNPDIPASDKIACGLSWCIANVNKSGPQFDVVSNETQTHPEKNEIGKHIEEALRTMGCPHPLQASQVQNLDCKGIFPVVQWLVSRVQTMQEDSRYEVTINDSIEEEEHTSRQLADELCNLESSITILNANLDEQNQRKVNALKQLLQLRERIKKERANAAVQKLLSLMESLKALERQESEFQSNCNAKRSQLQAEVDELEEKIATGCDDKTLSDGLNNSLSESLDKLNSAKRELAAGLRAIVSIKRQLDDVPSQSELIQYERGFSELYVHVQEKLRQTRKFYATYNALLEIKELMLKETSLLNSISSQFQDAITTTTGRVKLIDSMEGIVKGSQQKLEKVQLGLREEQKVCDALKEKYAAAIAEQRRSYSLLKAFQEECAKNERLRSISQ